MSIGNLLNQTITIYNKSSYNNDGSINLGSGTLVDARIQNKENRKILANGDVLVIDAIAYVPSDTTVATDYKVSYDSVTYKVFSVYKVPGGKGNVEFIKLELQKWQM